jgi:hypothetical protein
MAKAKRTSHGPRRPGRFRLFGLDGDRTMLLVGIAAATFLAVVLNVLAARRYTRWDVTTTKRYTLSDATRTTLRALPDIVHLWVLLGENDPLAPSLRALLESYGAETRRLEVHWVDPDRDALALEDVRKRFHIETGRTEEGRVVADAVVVAARGDRHWFVTMSDLVEVTNDGGGRVRPRHEQALTLAIRNVLGGEKSSLCFTTGHGELLLADGSDRGLGFLADLLEKQNYDLSTVDTTSPTAFEPFRGCDVVVIAGLAAPFSAEEANRLRTFLLEGGSLFAALDPIDLAADTGVRSAGLAPALEPFGIETVDAVVLETAPSRTFPDAGGFRFLAAAQPHPVTAGLVAGDEKRLVPRVVAEVVRPLAHATAKTSVAAQDLLVTTDRAYAKRSIAGAADARLDRPLERAEGDRDGPFAIAIASERPKARADAPHGPRVVVVGGRSFLSAAQWNEPLPLRGAALFVESALSWLSSQPVIVDVPAKGELAAGIRISDEGRAEVRRYVLVYVPLAAALLGLAVALRRRSTEGAKLK